MPRSVVAFALSLLVASTGVAAAAPEPGAEPDDWQLAAQIVQSIEEPDIPNRTYDITDYGAVGDGVTDARPAIMAAIADADHAGGGRVLLPAGTWHSAGPIHLASHIDLHVSDGATLRFSAEPADYLPVVRTRWEGTEMYGYSPLIYAYRTTDVAVTGGGTIDGNGAQGFAAWRSRQGPDQSALRQMGADGVPVEERVFGEGHYLRPSLIQTFEASDVLIEGITVVDAPMWVNHLVYTDDATVRGVTVEAHRPNNDGVAIDSSTNVLVEQSTFVDIGDDCVVVKSGRDEDGWRVGRPSENIVVRNNQMSGSEGGFAIGSEMSGGVRNVFVEDNTVTEIGSAFYVKANLDRGGVVERVRVRGFHVGEATTLLRFQTNYSGYRGGFFPPVFRDFRFESVVAGTVGTGISATGVDAAPIQDVTVRNSRVDHADAPLHLSHIEGFDLHNVRINGEPLPKHLWGGATLTTSEVDGIDVGETVEVTATFANRSGPVSDVRLGLVVPDGWDVRARTPATFPVVHSGQTVTTTWAVTRTSGRLGMFTLQAEAEYREPGIPQRVRFASDALVVSDPVTIEPGDVQVVQPAKLADVRVAEVGVRHYADRTNVITALPEPLAGGVLIPGANDDKRLTEPADYLVFDLARDATLLLALDNRGAPERGDWWPAWLAEQGFERTGMTIETNDSSQGGMTVFAKDVPAGRVTLGPTGAPTDSSSSYFTLVLSYGG